MLSGADLVEYLADTVAKNGNLLINVGPDSYGRIPSIQQGPLLELGAWMAVNGEAIYNTRPWQRYGNESGRTVRYTLGDDALYAIVPGVTGTSFNIEDPGITRESLEVLGAEVESSEQRNGELAITLATPVETPALVVRYSLP